MNSALTHFLEHLSKAAWVANKKDESEFRPEWARYHREMKRVEGEIERHIQENDVISARDLPEPPEEHAYKGSILVDGKPLEEVLNPGKKSSAKKVGIEPPDKPVKKPPGKAEKIKSLAESVLKARELLEKLESKKVDDKVIASYREKIKELKEKINSLA